MGSGLKLGIHLREEVELLELHCRTTQLVIANLVAAQERLLALPDDAKRQRLLGLQQQTIDAAEQSLQFSQAMLSHVQSLEALYANAS